MSVYERRKFLRVDSSLYAILNRQVHVAIKSLSLGGCEIESPEGAAIVEPVRLDFSIDGEHLTLTGVGLHRVGPNQFGLKFRFDNEEQAGRLMRALERMQKQGRRNSRAPRRPIEALALVNQEPSIITDISAGGCCLKTPARYRGGDIVEIRWVLDGREFALSAQVRWTAADGVGLEYLSPDRDALQHITDFITKKKAR